MTGDQPVHSARPHVVADSIRARTNGRSLILAAATAGICAVAAAIKVGNLLDSRASPNQLPGYAKTIGLDPRVDFRRFLLLLLLPALVGFGLRRLRAAWPRARISDRFFGRGFLGISIFAMALAATAILGLGAGVLIGLLVAAVAVFLQRPLARALGPGQIGFSAVVAGSILAWSFLTGPAVARGWSPLKTAPLLFLLAIAEAFWIGRGNFERGARGFGMSAVVIPLALWGSRPESVSWLAGLAVFALPAMTRGWSGDSERRRRTFCWLITFVLLPGSLVALSAAACLRVPPVADVFEDGHALLPASEYLRGEKPFQDILPGHGLLSDGGVQVASLKIFGEDYKGLRRGSKVVGALFWPAVYLVGLAATGNANVGFGAMLLSFLWFPQYMFFRVIASLGVLALASAAARTGRQRLWIATGVAVPLALITAVDFASFAAAACVVAIAISRRGWRRALWGFAVGLAPSAALLAALMALGGWLRSFLTTTFGELSGLMPAYAQGFHVSRSEIQRWLTGWRFLSDQDSFFGVALIGSAVAAAILAARFPQIGQRARALAPALVWFLAGTASVIERRHIGYPSFVLPIAIVLSSRWIVGWSGWDSLRGVLAASLLAAALFCARPFFLAGAVADALQTVRVPADLAQLEVPSRARGALFPAAERALLARTDEFLQSRGFGPSDTWLDFSNAPGLYYFFNRDCPVRYYEVSYYEKSSAQDYVIRSVEANRHVRAVLIRAGLRSDAIDGIPNAERAPRVADFIRREFHPSFSRDGVEFWERTTPGPLQVETSAPTADAPR